MENPLVALSVSAALGCAITGGVFFAFSTFIMRALARLPASQAIAAMQSINITVITPPFMLVLFGTGAVCVFLAGSALLNRQDAHSPWLLAASLLYFIGNIVVTVACNVPRNNTLASVDPESAAGANVWSTYLTEWTAWNHVRTITALGAAALLIAALRHT